MYKLIISDLDGTLLQNNGKISNLSINTIERAYKEKNVQFAISTGRALFSAKNFASKFNIPVIVSSFNGALIEIERKIVYSHPLTFHEVDIIGNVLSKFKQASIAFCDNTYLMEEGGPAYKRQSEVYNRDGIILPFSDLSSYAQKNNLTIYKFLVKHCKLEVQNEIVQALKKEDINLVFSASSVDTLEIMPEGIGKDISVGIIRNKLSIEENETIGFGDWDNDIPLLSAVHLPIAMENGSDSLKAIAKVICETNENDGLAKSLIKYLDL